MVFYTVHGKICFDNKNNPWDIYVTETDFSQTLNCLFFHQLTDPNQTFRWLKRSCTSIIFFIFFRPTDLLSISLTIIYDNPKKKKIMFFTSSDSLVPIRLCVNQPLKGIWTVSGAYVRDTLRGTDYGVSLNHMHGPKNQYYQTGRSLIQMGAVG